MAPSAGVVLADLGAEVVKIEPLDGDPTRKLRGFAAGFFDYFNRNKLSVAIDLKKPEGVALAHKLAAAADVALDNFAPDTMERLDCGPERLCSLNPRLIYCSMKGFLDGPYGNRPALDEVVQFMGGMAYMTGPSGRPLRAGTSAVDLMGGVMGVVAILAALRERDLTGKGQVVKSGLFEATAYMMGQHMASSAITGQKAVPMPEREHAFGIYDVFRTKDHEGVFIAITSDAHWRSFCSAFGADDLSNDQNLRTNSGRVAARPQLLDAVGSLIGGLSQENVLRLCGAANIPFAPVAKVEDLFEDPHLNQSGALLDVILGGVPGKLPRLPISMENHKIGLRRNAPRVGEHTTEILQSAGIGSGEIERLRERKIVA